MTLDSVWSRLGTIGELTFTTSSSASTGWSGSGTGTVDVAQPSSNILVYTEAGIWSPNGGKPLNFTNVYRWTLLPDSLRLEHLRFGPDNPVYLFDLGIVDGTRMKSVAPHV